MKFTRQLYLLIVLWLAVASVHAYAQEPIDDLAQASLEQLGRITVSTASRHLQLADDAPSSVTVVTADDIRKQGYRTLADVLQTVRGMFATYDREYSSLGVRGLARPGDFNTRILLLVDGHRLNDNVYDEALIGTEFPIDIDMVSRIEIIRGPVSSLYGSNALFAVVNVITRRGHELNGLELSTSAGSFNSYAGRISYGGTHKGLEFLISGNMLGSRGHNRLYFRQFDSPETSNGIANHLDDLESGSGIISLSFRGLAFQAVYGSRDKQIPTAAYSTLFDTPGTHTKDTRSYFDLRYEHMFAGGWNVAASASYDRYAYSGRYMYESTLGPDQISPNLDAADGKWAGSELHVSRMFFSNHLITAGGEYQNNFRQNQTSYYRNPDEVVLDDRRSSFRTAAFVQDEVTITRSVSVNAGVRYDYYSHAANSTDPRIALIFRPASKTVLKLIYAHAFRVPNVYELYYSVDQLPNPTLSPERIRSYEIVLEQGFSKGLWVSASSFHNSMKGLITQLPTDSDLLIFQNLKRVDSTGVEFEVKDQLPHGLTAAASYAFQQTENTVTDSFLNNSPRHLGKLSLSQSLFHKQLSLSVNAQYRSGMQVLSGSAPPFAVVNSTVLGRNIGHYLDISASIYNLLDKNYFDPPSSANLYMPIQQDGRSFRVKLVWHAGAR